ncbi:GNAT family N-acetyltransferase [Paenibacillus turpanensis]|uniref:GNAT family N-acetyltransferase n=1 Tax=Paenibacillus turpanensis TaxID=2689078 RepID=UPI00140E8349|nr:GNAT family N-acetyltransferase [Paenibacillus turpanensis]
MLVSRIADSEADLQAAFRIRETVFVQEQHVPLADEFDEHESTADHILVLDEDTPAGAGRLRVVDGTAKLERICVLPAFRKLGAGAAIVGALEGLAIERGLTKAKLHGQVQAQRFYEKLGYRCASEPFMEDGILHVLMVKEL